MKLSIQWLRDLVDLPEDVEEICDRLTLLGLEVESHEPFVMEYPHVIVGKVLAAVQHPNADRLRVCKVSTGSEELSIVCGASNVRAGLHVAVAVPGAILPGNFKIKKSKIRGEASAGMICSESELGLGQGHEGILELSEEHEVGRALDDLFGYRDDTVEIEVTPNRPDWLSHIGVARELSAHYRTELRIPDPGDALEFAAEAAGWKVSIEDPEGCRRFTGRLIDGVQIGESPLWLRQRLAAIGQRSINAIVDASNYVLHECGQPNHVFDRKKLSGREIVVRRAAKGERFTTLDDSERVLTPNQLMIADREKSLGIAGVMGGANSEVDDSTTELLVEVAEFDPLVTRRSRRELALSTDASYRFERGIDPNAMAWATRRVTQLILESCGGTADSIGFASDGRARPELARFFVRAPQFRRVVGAQMSRRQMCGIFAGLGIVASVTERDGVEGVDVEQPSFRHDLLEEVDAIEELARHYGYDKLDVARRAPMLRPAERAPGEIVRRKLREQLAGRRYHEVVTSSFMMDDDPARLGQEGAPRLGVLNPVVSEEGWLKTSSVPAMLRILDRNRRRGHTGPVRLFQIDRCFRPVVGETLPEESESLVLLWSTERDPVHFAADTRPFALYDALGEVESLLAAASVDTRRDPTRAAPYHREGAGVGLVGPDGLIGSVGQISPRVAAAFELEEPVFLAEIQMPAFETSGSSERAVDLPSPYPPVRRDLSLLVPDTVPYSAVEALVREGSGVLLESLEVFDLYSGEGVPGGHRALGLRLSLRSASGTLKDKKVDSLLESLLRQLGERHDVRLRDGAE